MNSDRINEVFQGLGKFIKLAEIGAAYASGVKVHMVATLQQFGQQVGGADYYDDLISVVIPLETRTQPTVAALERVPNVAKAAVESYLRTMAPEVNAATTASFASILTNLKNDMAAAGHTVYPSGTLFNYFNNNFGFTGFPTSNTPTIPNDWVSSDVIIP
jgi:hypothetical protein